MSAIGEGELKRECRRLLRAMSGGGVLSRVDDKRFVLVRPGGAKSGTKIWASAGLVQEMAARGFLEMQGHDSYCPSTLALDHIAQAGQQGSSMPYADRHRRLETRNIRDDGADTVTVKVNVLESPLSFLRARKLISAPQFEAGERLRDDFTKAGMAAHVCVDLAARYGRRSGPYESFSDVVLAAKQRVRNAMRALGPGLCDIAFDVCCTLKGLEGIEKAHAWPRSSAKVVLRLALDRLAAHYGLNVSRTNAPIGAWQAMDTNTSPGEGASDPEDVLGSHE